MIDMAVRDRCRLIAGHVTTEYARGRVSKALYEAVVEGLEIGPGDLPLAEDRDWIRGAIGIPLREATDAALRVLTGSVTRTLERAPDGLLDRFVESHHLEELVIEYPST